jgi:hypothetical protein
MHRIEFDEWVEDIGAEKKIMLFAKRFSAAENLFLAYNEVRPPNKSYQTNTSRCFKFMDMLGNSRDLHCTLDNTEYLDVCTLTSLHISTLKVTNTCHFHILLTMMMLFCKKLSVLLLTILRQQLEDHKRSTVGSAALDPNQISQYNKF